LKKVVVHRFICVQYLDFGVRVILFTVFLGLVVFIS
jgi:hypothetical protein